MGYLRIIWADIMLSGQVILSLWGIGGQTRESYSVAAAEPPKSLTRTDDASALPSVTTAIAKPRSIQYRVKWAGAVNSSPPSGRFAGLSRWIKRYPKLLDQIIFSQTATITRLILDLASITGLIRLLITTRNCHGSEQVVFRP